MPLHIDPDLETIAAFCRRNGVRRLSFFGSVTTEHFGPDSDVDVLIDFDAGANVGLFELVDMRDELSGIIAPASLSHFFRERVVETAEVAYAA
jgi:predicted nucleotidyltransferase